uniref:Uncharacterized protein n=1 Tax=Anguilla anguilla TaxID=7936 RepID=A0A0E9VEP2_ANGAN
MSPSKLNFLSLIRFSSRKGRGNIKSIPRFALPSAQSIMNFCTETVLPMPAIPLVRTGLLMWSSCPGKGWNILLHSICTSRA